MILAETAATRSKPGARVAEFLLHPRPVALLLCGSFAFAIVFCLSMFDVGFLLGTSSYWQAPRGLVPNSWADISTALSGYNYFVRDAWTLPLFRTSKLGAPDAINIIFTDSIPIVAVCGRLLYRATGLVLNPYGAWTALCFVASAMSMTGLVAALGQRGIAAAMMATVAGLCMPALLYRWGHMSLMAQWELPCALIMYFRSGSSRRAIGVVAASLLLAAVALWTLYLFVMVTGILAAALAQATIDRRLRLPQAAGVAALFAIVLFALMFISGHLSNQGSFGAEGFGEYSMNLLSPIIPQFSGLFPFMSQRVVDATGGQYEGFSYLGAGILLLAIAALLRLRRATAGLWRGHACLIALLLAFAAFAVSNQIHVGAWHAATIPLPEPILAMASIFRSSGRFFWPSLYLLTAVAIVAAPSLWGRAGAWLLVSAMLVQVVDTAPLRSALAASIAAPAPTPLAEARWADAIRRHELVRVLPPFHCLSNPRDLAAQTALELQLLASRENVATNTVYAARRQENCAPPEPTLPAPRELRVYLLADPRAPKPGESATGCAASATLAVCSRELDPLDLAALIAPKPE